MNKLNLLSGFLVLFTVHNLFAAQIRDFQTTRLNSTAGTGVASILSTEAALLNPATSAFFEESSASYQSYGTRLKDKSEERAALNDTFAKRNKSDGFFLTDHSGEVKGGVAYINQRENNYERERMVLHGAVPMGSNAAMGVSYNYIEDKLPRNRSNRHRLNHLLSMGTVLIPDDKTVLGLVLIDPTRTIPGEERILAGFQYNIAERFILMGDVGYQYTKSVTDKNMWRAAAQINIFADFFLRAGKFYDKINNFQGTGWGVGWMGPRLGVEFAQKFTEQFGKNSYIYKNETLVDSSLSAVIKF